MILSHNTSYILGVHSLLINNSPTKINIISNDLNSAESLEIILNQNQFVVQTTLANSENTETIKANNPDVIILDFWSAENDSIGICMDIRTFSIAPILVLTSENKPGMVEALLNAGADECLIKPASSNILVARLNNLARRYREEKKAKITLMNPIYEDTSRPILQG